MEELPKGDVESVTIINAIVKINNWQGTKF